MYFVYINIFESIQFLENFLIIDVQGRRRDFHLKKHSSKVYSIETFANFVKIYINMAQKFEKFSKIFKQTFKKI